MEAEVALFLLSHFFPHQFGFFRALLRKFPPAAI